MASVWICLHQRPLGGGLCDWAVDKGVCSNWHPYLQASSQCQWFRIFDYFLLALFHLTIYVYPSWASPGRGKERISLSCFWGCCLSFLQSLSKTTDSSCFLLCCHYQLPSLPSNYKCPTSLVSLPSLCCCQFCVAGAEGGSREQRSPRHLSFSSLEIGPKKKSPFYKP